jgi:hypothetical protein
MGLSHREHFLFALWSQPYAVCGTPRPIRDVGNALESCRAGFLLDDARLRG